MSGGPLFGGSAQVETLVRLHVPLAPNRPSACTPCAQNVNRWLISTGVRRPAAGHGRGAAVTARGNRFIVET